jgi:hypothetical protein
MADSRFQRGLSYTRQNATAEDNEVQRPGKEICLEANHSIYHNLTPRIGRLGRVEKVKASTDMTVAMGNKIKRTGQLGGAL